MYIYDHISLNSSYYEKCFRQTYRECQNTHFVSDYFSSENYDDCNIMWKNMVQPD
jgi:poly-D-alanine transfer protein DltD